MEIINKNNKLILTKNDKKLIINHNNIKFNYIINYINKHYYDEILLNILEGFELDFNNNDLIINYNNKHIKLSPSISYLSKDINDTRLESEILLLNNSLLLNNDIQSSRLSNILNNNLSDKKNYSNNNDLNDNDNQLMDLFKNDNSIETNFNLIEFIKKHKDQTSQTSTTK